MTYHRPMSSSDPLVRLRELHPSDLDIFFSHMQDTEAVRMAAFTPPDPGNRIAFDEHWERLTSDETVQIRTITINESVVGHIASFNMFGEREVTYWLGREVWGSGIATGALRQFLEIESTRPLFGRAASDNTGSIRVLEKCGFVKTGSDRGYANARGEEVEESILRLG